jgi:hypothetical protein
LVEACEKFDGVAPSSSAVGSRERSTGEESPPPFEAMAGRFLARESDPGGEGDNDSEEEAAAGITSVAVGVEVALDGGGEARAAAELSTLGVSPEDLLSPCKLG